MVVSAAASSSTADKKFRICETGQESAGLKVRGMMNRGNWPYAHRYCIRTHQNGVSKTYVEEGTYHLMTPVPQFLARSCLEVISNMHKLVMEVLDG